MLNKVDSAVLKRVYDNVMRFLDYKSDNEVKSIIVKKFNNILKKCNILNNLSIYWISFQCIEKRGSFMR